MASRTMGVVTLVLMVCVLAPCVAHSSLFFRSEQRAQQQPQADEDKVWLFAVDGLKRPFAFVNEVGALVGFDVDVISAVCKIANKSCDVVLAEFTECIFTFRNMNFPGRGLMSGWFDACPSFAITEDRAATFDFTTPYLNTVTSFTVLPGNPSGFDPSLDDYSNFTLGHLTGAPTNAACLRRQGKKFGNFVIAKDLPEARALLENRTVQAVFSPRVRIEGLEVMPANFRCDKGGAGMMVKKGSSLPQWWNPAFKTFFDSGDYYRLCLSDSQRFSYLLKCLDPSPATTTPPPPNAN